KNGRKVKEVKMVVVTSENEKELERIESQRDKKLETIQESDGSSEYSDREAEEKQAHQQRLAPDEASADAKLPMPTPTLLQARSDGMRNQADEQRRKTNDENADSNEDDNHKRHKSWQAASKKGNRVRRLIRDDSE
ncbi:hypothetical protein RFI_39563, partial [Reticulomyxa filosa]